MSEEVVSVVRGIEKRFRDLSVDLRSERVIRYLVRQLLSGRHIDDVMSDDYIIEHTTEVDRNNILQNPAIISAIEQEITQQFASYRSATLRRSADGGSE